MRYLTPDKTTKIQITMTTWRAMLSYMENANGCTGKELLAALPGATPSHLNGLIENALVEQEEDTLRISIKGIAFTRMLHDRRVTAVPWQGKAPLH
jgi:hypothetical protein